MTIFLNIGSNLGDRRHNIARAIAEIAHEFGYFELSHIMESSPWGFKSENTFFNIGMMINSNLDPLEILRRLQSIEKKFSPLSHRTSEGAYTDRIIDIDIIAIDDLIVNLPELTLPHPRMSERRFVLEPLAELAPMWHHPISGLTPYEMLSSLEV